MKQDEKFMHSLSNEIKEEEFEKFARLNFWRSYRNAESLVKIPRNPRPIISQISCQGMFKFQNTSFGIN